MRRGVFKVELAADGRPRLAVRGIREPPFVAPGEIPQLVLFGFAREVAVGTHPYGPRAGRDLDARNLAHISVLRAPKDEVRRAVLLRRRKRNVVALEKRDSGVVPVGKSADVDLRRRGACRTPAALRQRVARGEKIAVDPVCLETQPPAPVRKRPEAVSGIVVPLPDEGKPVGREIVRRHDAGPSRRMREAFLRDHRPVVAPCHRKDVRTASDGASVAKEIRVPLSVRRVDERTLGDSGVLEHDSSLPWSLH